MPKENKPKTNLTFYFFPTFYHVLNNQIKCKFVKNWLTADIFIYMLLKAKLVKIVNNKIKTSLIHIDYLETEQLQIVPCILESCALFIWTEEGQYHSCFPSKSNYMSSNFHMFHFVNYFVSCSIVNLCWNKITTYLFTKIVV